MDAAANLRYVLLTGAAPANSVALGVGESENTTSQPVEIATLLRGIADSAAGFTEQLDALRGQYPAQGLHGADPVAIILEQAAAAAHDLSNCVTTAADAIVGRRSATGHQHRRVAE